MIKLQDNGKGDIRVRAVLQMVKAGQKLHDEATDRTMRYLNILKENVDNLGQAWG